LPQQFPQVLAQFNGVGVLGDLLRVEQARLRQVPLALDRDRFRGLGEDAGDGGGPPRQGGLGIGVGVVEGAPQHL
jgi:hypothetical protein